MRALNLKPRKGGVSPSVWDAIPLTEMLPERYRMRAEAIIKQDPDLIWVLEACKSCELDAFDALRLLGIEYDG